MIRLMIVEDQAMLRDSLACTINTQSDMEVVASLGDAAEALEALERSGATCALLDVCTENDSSGIVAARKIKEAHPEVKVVIMTGMPEITFVEQARTAGVDSFVYKNVGTTELLGIIRSTVDYAIGAHPLRHISKSSAQNMRLSWDLSNAVAAIPHWRPSSCSER